MAEAFGGFEAVDRMTWQDFALARQFLTERHVGRPHREAKAREDQIAKQAKQALEGQERRGRIR